MWQQIETAGQLEAGLSRAACENELEWLLELSELSIRHHFVHELHTVLPHAQAVPVLERDQLPGGAEESEGEPSVDEEGRSADISVGVYSGDLVTRASHRRPIEGEPELVSVKAHEGGHDRSGVRQQVDASRDFETGFC